MAKPITMETVDFANVDQVAKLAMTIGNTKSDKIVFHTLAELMWKHGSAVKGRGLNKFPDDEAQKVFAAFQSVFWTRENDRDPLTPSTAANYASGFKAFSEAGALKSYDARPIVDAALKLKGNYATIGSKVRKVLEAHKETAPTSEQITATLNPPPTPAELADKLDRMVKAFVALEKDHAAEFAKSVSLKRMYDMTGNNLVDLNSIAMTVKPSSKVPDFKARVAAEANT